MFCTIISGINWSVNGIIYLFLGLLEILYKALIPCQGWQGICDPSYSLIRAKPKPYQQQISNFLMKN